MQHGQVGVLAFFPAHQQPSKSVEPAVGALHNPARSAPCVSAQPILLSALASTRPLSARQAGLPEHQARTVPCILGVVAQVHAQARARLAFPRLFDGQVRQCLSHQRHIVPVGRRCHDRQRQARAIGQQTVLGTALSSVARLGVGFSPRPKAPWSSCHRAPATPNRCDATPRTAAGPASKRS